MTAPREFRFERPWPPAGTRSTPSRIRLLDVSRSTPSRSATARLLRLVESWHRSARRPGPLAFDAAVALLLVAWVTSSAQAAVEGAATFTAAALAVGLAKPRTGPEAQGVRWYSRPALMTAALVACALAAGGTPTASAAEAAATIFLFGALSRAIVWQVIAAARRRGVGLRPALLIAPEEWAGRLRQRMSIFPEAGLMCEGVAPLPVPGEDHTRLALAIERSRATHLVIADAEPAVVRRVVAFAGERFNCSVVVQVKGAAGRGRIGDIDLVPVPMRPSWGSMACKRVVDLAGASALLLLLSPLLAATALAIRLSDGGPAIFRQKRVGRDGCLFTCLKFRSMVVGAEHYHAQLESDNITGGLLFKLERDPRVTPVGRFIRRFSIDELPQLVNVLSGDMSLVGPRPLPVDPARFSSDAQPRHSVPPGLTGLWQVCGANALGYEDMLELDFSYVTSRSLAVDLMLLMRTIPAVLVRRSPA